jgi:carbon starvation protein
MARDEIGPIGGFTALIGVLLIMVILIAVLGLVVVNAMKHSMWATSTVATTVPIAMFVGLYMVYLRPGRIIEASAVGVILVLFAVIGGRFTGDLTLGKWFDLDAPHLAGWIIAYGFVASVLPIWLLLAPRDYLSAYIKIGTIIALAIGIVALHPPTLMPALTRFIDGSGPIFGGKVFPFAFITVACGAISGFHSLIASGTTPKMLTRETDARMIGYGAMLMESFVAVMAMIAAIMLKPGIYFAINAPAGVVGVGAAACSKISGWGFPVSGPEMQRLAAMVGETSLFARTGGAPSLAVGMAQIFAGATGGGAVVAVWYHFAIMFEALFILSTLDAGTRVARFMLQDLAANLWPRLGRHDTYGNILATSALIVAAWGYFLYFGAIDPLGGINSLWPLFGIANQMLAVIALAVATSAIIRWGKARYAWLTLLPISWLVVVTLTAGYQKIFSTAPNIGFLAHAATLRASMLASPANAVQNARLIWNDRVDAVITGFFIMVVLIVLADALRVWTGLLSGLLFEPNNVDEAAA